MHKEGNGGAGSDQTITALTIHLLVRNSITRTPAGCIPCIPENTCVLAPLALPAWPVLFPLLHSPWVRWRINLILMQYPYVNIFKCWWLFFLQNFLLKFQTISKKNIFYFFLFLRLKSLSFHNFYNSYRDVLFFSQSQSCSNPKYQDSKFLVSLVQLQNCNADMHTFIQT